jgi:hypothetical protein
MRRVEPLERVRQCRRSDARTRDHSRNLIPQQTRRSRLIQRQRHQPRGLAGRHHGNRMIREAVYNAAGKGGTNEIEWIDAADTST